MLQFCTSKDDAKTVILEEIAKMYPEGLKAKDTSSMNFTLWNAIRLVHSEFYKAKFGRYLKELLDGDLREQRKSSQRKENRTQDQIDHLNARKRKSVHRQRLKLAVEAAEACLELLQDILKSESLLFLIVIALHSSILTNCFPQACLMVGR
jgi:hypothetical protein